MNDFPMTDTGIAYGDPQPEEETPLAYGDAVPVASQLSEADLTARASRADFALGENSPGHKELKDAFADGREGEIRSATAASANAEFKLEKLKKVQELVAKDKSITAEDVNGLMAAGTTPEADPKTVFEDKFAKNFVNAGVIGDPATNLVFQSAFDTVPEETQKASLIAAGVITRNHVVKGVLEKARAAYENLPWFGDGGMAPQGDEQQDKFSNHAKNILSGGIASIVNLRNLINKNPTNSILPGSNQLEQIQSLFMLPHNKIEDTLMASVGPGSEFWRTNPVDAMTFLEAAAQYSASDSYVDNTLGVFNVASMIPFGLAGRGLAVMRGGKALAQPSVQSLETALQAAQDVLKASPKAPVKYLTGDGMNAASNAMDILSTSSKAPEPGYYLPSAAVQRPWEASPRLGEMRVEGGKPRVFTDDGIEVALSRTPEEGHYPLSVSTAPEKTTFRTKDAVYEVHPEGVTRDGQAPTKTIYVDKAGAEKLSKLKEEGKNYDLLQDDKGNYFVGDRDNIAPGKMVKGTKTKASDTPERGLYPIQISEDEVHFSSSKITSVEKNTDQRIILGPKIAPAAEIEAKNALADIAKAQNETNVVDALSKMGQHEEAAKVQAVTTLENQFNKVVQQGDPEAIRRAIPSSASPQPFYHNSASLSRERATRLADEALTRDIRLGDVVVNPQRVERLTGEALRRAVDSATQAVRDRYNRASNAILDVVNGVKLDPLNWDSAANVYFIETRFGKRDGTLFDSKAAANFARTMDYRLGSSATVEQEGNKFYLSHIQHVDETPKGVREGLIVSGNETPRGFWNTFVNTVTGVLFKGGTLRSSRYTTSEFQMNNRIAATHIPSVMKQQIEAVAKEIEKLGTWTTNERHELQRILEHNRDFMHPDGERGTFYTSAFEFETAFNNMFQKMPSEKQIVAYEHFTRLSDLDATLRMLDLHRDKARQGIRNYQLSYSKNDELGIPQKGKTDWFHGKKVEDFDPVNTQNANIYVMPEGRFTTKHGLKKETVEDLLTQKKIKEGKYQIIQVYNPGSKPLKDATGIKDNIHFVVVDKFDDKAIKLGEGFVYRPGGHVIYQDNNFMKQAQIGTGTLGRMTHFGDTTVKSFASPIEGKMFIDRYNHARVLLHEGKEAELQAYIDAGNLPETLPEFKKLFTDGGASLSTEHPFVLTTTGRNTFQSSPELTAMYPDLKDTFSSYDLTQTQGGAYLAERNQQLNTIANKGTEANPIYHNVPSRLYDPFTALQKGMAQIVRERWMGDYKISAAESWVQEFGLLFDQSKLPMSKLRQNPIYWLYHAEGNLDMGVARTQLELLSAALTSRKNILNFIGARDELGGILDGLERKMIQGIDTIGGAKLAGMVEERALPAIKSVPGYARAAAFHTVIGLNNVVQVFQQGIGLGNILFISPKHGFKATTASALVRRYRYTEDPAILSSMGDHAAGLNGKLDQTFGTGWTKEHFMEAYSAWKNSGTHNIGGETALLSEIQDPKLFMGAGQKFLNKSTIFFRVGESVVRDTAYFAAYSEWRTANPTAALTNRAMGDIGRRFDTLSNNMTRASNAGYNEGIFSIPAQFWTWNARFAEQVVGKQLTWQEKTRLIVGNAALFGIPATLGGITFGLPLSDMTGLSAITGLPNPNYQDIREYALKNNIDVSDKWYQAFSEGIAAVMINTITGHDTDFQRFSPNATQIKEILDGKKSAYEVFGGASGAFVVNALHAVAPAYNYVMSAFKSDSHFPVKMNDLKTVFELASSFSNGERMYIGLTLGKNVMKKEGIVDNEIDTFEAMMLVLGLQPKRDSDAYTKLNIMKEREAVQKKMSKSIQEDTLIGLKAGMRGDMRTMSDYMTRVKTYILAGDFTKQQEIDEFKKATRGVNQDLVTGVERQWIQKMNEMQSIPSMKKYFENMQKAR